MKKQRLSQSSSGITFGDNNTIYGDVFLGDKVINFVTAPSELISSYRGLIRNFLDYYSGTEKNPRYLGGRSKELLILDDWLNKNENNPFAILLGPAGIGKSTLMAQWHQRLNKESEEKKDNKVRVIYFPISARFETNLESIVFTSLAFQVAEIFNQKLPPGLDIKQYRAIFTDFMARKPPSGVEKILIIIDGLDEIADWIFYPGIFPTSPSDHLKVIVTARHLSGFNINKWLNKLGWNSLITTIFQLSNIDSKGIKEIVSQLPLPKSINRQYRITCYQI